MPFPSSWRARAAAAATILYLALGALERLDPLKEGLAGLYSNGLEPASAPVVAAIDAPPSTARITAAWHASAPQAFSATWTGGILVPRDGAYTFGTVSDDASHLYIDGQLIVDNGGAHGPERKTGSIALTFGVHAIFVDYNQQGGGYELNLMWSKDGGTLDALPGWVLANRRVSLSRFLPSAAVWGAREIAWWIWIGAILLLLSSGIVAAMRPVVTSLNRDGAWRVLRWVLLGSLVLNVIGIGWGLPGEWPPAELSPKAVLEGMERHFSHGWYDTYPPFHFYVLSALISPALWLERLGRLDLSGGHGYTILAVLMRVASLVGAAAALIATCMTGRRAFGGRAGVLGAAALALTTLFVYYSKTSNTDMPYVVWFAISLVFYLRVLDDLRLSDFVLFAATATLSVTSKDQAYGMYLFMPLPIAYRLWNAHRSAGATRALWRAVTDRRLWTAAAVAAVLFALIHNLLFNYRGFVDHVRYIVGPGAENYQVYDATFAGHMELLGLTLRLIQQSFGWPLTAAAAIGVGIAVSTPSLRRITLWLFVPVVSYYLTFIDVVLYNYDRFVMPICVVLAIFAGLALDRLLGGPGTVSRWRLAGVVVVFVYSALYSATVDALMVGDSRYASEQWLATHAGRDDLVAYTFALEYLPRFDDVHHEEIRSIDALQERRPEFFVLNADYARAVPSDSPTGALIAGLQQGRLGYVRAFEYRHPSPWPWLPAAHHDLTGPRHERRVATILRNINPTIQIFARQRE